MLVVAQYTKRSSAEEILMVITCDCTAPCIQLMFGSAVAAFAETLSKTC